MMDEICPKCKGTHKDTATTYYPCEFTEIEAIREAPLKHDHIGDYIEVNTIVWRLDAVRDTLLRALDEQDDAFGQLQKQTIEDAEEIGRLLRALDEAEDRIEMAVTRAQTLSEIADEKIEENTRLKAQLDDPKRCAKVVAENCPVCKGTNRVPAPTDGATMECDNCWLLEMSLGDQLTDDPEDFNGAGVA